MNIRLLALAGAVAGVTFGSAASAQTLPVPQAHVRSDGGSDRNVRVVRRRLEGMIDQLQRDRHDYGGHRLRAIADLQQARAELEAALRDDAGH